MNFHRFPTQLSLFNSAVIFITTLLLSPALSAATNCATQGQIPQAECLALVDLYTSTNGPAWTDNAANNWNVTNTPCSWTGVTCSGGHVTQIIRGGQNLIGTLPLSLNTLTSLTNLNLTQNSLSGNIPSLPASLTTLNLNYNSLSGSIPTLPASLTTLSLAVNSLTGSIPALPTGLTSLDLTQNSLTGSIPTLPAGLTTLYLSYNSLSSIPSLPATLTNLNLSSNSLSSIPSLPATLTNLNLSSNSLSSILSLPASLTYLNLSSNNLSSIPSLPAGLQDLNLSSNNLSSIPSLPATLTNLNLSNNALTGTLPSFASLTSLTTLDLGYNALTGAFSVAEDTSYVSPKQANWKDTQTVAPTGLTATALSSSQVQVNWTLITYTTDGGYYQVKYATTPGGPYTNASTTTANKSVSSYTVTGLTPGTPYYFVVETYTPAHSPQQNNLTSILLAGQETSVTTCPATTTVTSTADSGPNTLRQALTNACLSDMIIMNVSGSPISLVSDLNITQNVTIDANNQAFDVTGWNFVAPGKNITITNASNINVVIIDTSTSSATPAGNISLTATGIITLQRLHATSINTGNAGKGGDITVNAGGGISTVDILSYSKSTSSGTASNSGDIQLISTGGNITTDILIARSLGITGSGNGGIINVQAVSGYILINNAYLMTDSSHGAANNITLTANTVRITGANSGKSIIANGATANGTITITTGASPFTVGDITTNGTAGDIYQSATNNITASPATIVPPYYPPVGININNVTRPIPPPVIPPPPVVTPPPTVTCQTNITVTTTDDTGPGSLREALLKICPRGQIDFATTITLPIYLASPLAINQDLTLVGRPGMTLSGDSNNDSTGDVRVLEITSGNVVLNDLIITKGQARSNNGAGILIDTGATVTLTRCQLLDNQTTVQGGGLQNEGTLIVNNSTFARNAANVGGSINNTGKLTITNSTFANNSATSTGGGINNLGTLAINNSTFANQPGGGLHNVGTLSLTNTIIAKSLPGGDCSNTGTLLVNLNNLIADGSCNPALTGDPMLGELQENGGSLPTLALSGSSPAIDAGDNTTCATTDQRGINRPFDGDHNNDARCDIGAYEYNTSCQVKPVVTTTVENSAGSLREAIMTACEGGRIMLTVGGTFALTTPLTINKNVTIDGTGQTFSLTGNSIFTMGKNLEIIGEEMTLDGIDTTTTNTTPAGKLILTAHTGNLTVKEIKTASDTTTGNAGAGGNVTVTAPLGSIHILGDILTYSESDFADASQAGNVTLTAGKGIDTGAINASAFAPKGQAGQGGVIHLSTAHGDLVINGFLNSGSIATGTSGVAGNIDLQAPQGNITIHSYLLTGTNGVINIFAGQTFQALGQIPKDLNNTISSAANITIHHGGHGLIPFIVGSASTNGTTFGITSGSTVIPAGKYLDNYILGPIQILTEIQPVPSYLSSPSPNSTLDFGKSTVGTPIALPLQLNNVGSATLEVQLTGLTGQDASDFSVLSPTFPITLAPGTATQDVMVQCLPSKEGERKGSLQLSSNDPQNPLLTYELICIGMPEKDKSEKLDLHEVDSTPLHTPILLEVTVTNSSETDWEVEWEGITGDQAEDFSVFQTLFPLKIPKQPGTGVITVQCQPSARGIRRAQLELHTNDPLTPTLSYLLICIGEVPGPAYDSWPAPGQTLQVNSPADPPTAPLTLDLTLVAVGTDELQISFDGLTGPEATDFTLLSPTFPVTLTHPGEAVAIIIACNPTANGLRRATLQLRTNDPVQPTISYELSCPGVAVPAETPPAGTPAVGTPTVGTPTVGTPTVGTPTVGTPASSGTANPGGTSTSPSGTQTPSANHAPSDFFLSYHTVTEHSPAGTVIGVFFTPDLNTNDFPSYTLRNGGPFVIVDDELQVADGANLDFNTLASYTILVTSTTARGLTIDKSFTIEVAPVTAAGGVTSVGDNVSSATSLPANLTNHFEGIIRTDLGEIGRQVSIDAPERFQLIGKIHPLPEHLGKVADILAIYHWQPVTGDPLLTGAMTVAKQQVLTEPLELTVFQGTLVGLAGVFEVSLGYQLTEKDSPLLSAPIVTLTVRPNHPPTALHLSANTIAELSPENTVIGHFTTEDKDRQDWFIYGLLDDAGHYFQVVGDKLQTTAFSLHLASGAEREITVRCVDAAGGFIDQRFTIHVTPVVVKPTAIHLTRHTVLENSPTGTVIGRLVTEARKPGSYRYELLDDAQGRFQLKADLLVVADGTRLDFEQQRSHAITVRVEDTSTHQTLTSPLTIEVLNQVDVKLEDVKISTPAGRRLQATEAVNATEEVLIELQLLPESTQIGETVELIIFGQFLQAGQVQLKMLAGEQWQVWDGDVGTLRAVIKSLTLLPRQAWRWQGALTAFQGSGPVEFYVGYRRANGEVSYSSEAIKVQVQ